METRPSQKGKEGCCGTSTPQTVGDSGIQYDSEMPMDGMGGKTIILAW